MFTNLVSVTISCFVFVLKMAFTEVKLYVNLKILREALKSPLSHSIGDVIQVNHDLNGKKIGNPNIVPIYNTIQCYACKIL